MKVLAIPGSLRAASSNAAILRAARERAPAGMEITLYAGHSQLPPYEPEQTVLPAAVVELRAQVAAADAVMISSPEYAHGIPGALKNTLDWLIDAPGTAETPILVFGASPGAGEFSHPALLGVARVLSRRVIDGGALHFSQSKLGPEGTVVSPAILEALDRGLAQLVAA